MFPYPSLLLLEKGLVELGIPLHDTVIEDIPIRGTNNLFPLLWKYTEELVLFNKHFDLVGTETDTELGKSNVVVRHLLDSIAPWKKILSLCGSLSKDLHLKDSICIADVGSGAGFPGVPLSLLFPYIHFNLIERMQRRCSFLENVVAALGLSNVRVHAKEIEKLSLHQFDLIVFRAFKPLSPRIVQVLMDKKKSEGFLVAWKAKIKNIKEEMGKIESLIDSWEALPIQVPFLDGTERHIVLIK